MKKALKYVCPGCSGTSLVEIKIECVVSTPITLSPDGQYQDVGEDEVHSGQVEHYRCKSCGYQPCDENGAEITERTELADWLAALPCNQLAQAITEKIEG